MVTHVSKGKPKRFLWEKSPGVWYVRRGGKYTRIRAAAGTEAFDREYWAILTGKTVPARSWRALVELYRAGDRWTRLAPRTRLDYDLALAYILEKNADKDATKTTRQDVVKALEANRHRTRFANTLRTVLIVLIEAAIDAGWMRENPARGARKLEVPKDRTAEHIPWTDEAVAIWRANARPGPRLIFEVGVGSVQRPADWCRFRWCDYDGEGLRLVQGKTGKALFVPCTPELKAALDAARPDPCDPSRPILTKADGDPYSYRTLSWAMLAERKRLGLEAYDLHACRYRGVMELAWSGCDDDQISAISGHNTRAMVAKYAGIARQVMRAREATAMRANRYGPKAEPDTLTDTP